MSRKLVLWITASFAILGLMLWVLSLFWQNMRDGISGHGWAAYIIGGVLTLALSIGLFLLTFHSARHGYDDIDRPDERGEHDV
ncbi:hypothetical protein [Hyphomonas pacifica]|uniref:hypothetical protein n=1 Tax=Hyphomonas pacifica TaxID=1280941 RepID=UPI000DC03DD0|nr:hypothetical protein [Hyphomonas pacifica]RAN36635.1 hypothetical protein HY11_11860 [Hyphomonas pacifica]